MIKSILKIISENKPEENITTSTDLFESGLLDSFDLLVLIGEFEEEFGLSIPGEYLVPEHFSSPSSIESLLKKLLKD